MRPAVQAAEFKPFLLELVVFLCQYKKDLTKLEVQSFRNGTILEQLQVPRVLTVARTSSSKAPLFAKVERKTHMVFLGLEKVG